MANIIIHGDERHEQQNAALREYGIDPCRASSLQREMADCIRKPMRLILKPER